MILFIPRGNDSEMKNHFDFRIISLPDDIIRECKPPERVEDQAISYPCFSKKPLNLVSSNVLVKTSAISSTDGTK